MIKWFMLVAWVLFGISFSIGLAYAISSWLKIDKEIGDGK